MKTKSDNPQKLTLKKEILASLDDSEMISLSGGFLSIGHMCSHRNDCSRVHDHIGITPPHGGAPAQE